MIRRLIDGLHARFGTPQRPAPAPKLCLPDPEPGEPHRKKRKINDLALVLASVPTRVDPLAVQTAMGRPAGRRRAQAFHALFPIATPPPGVPADVVKGQKLAMDDAYGYASVSQFGDVTHLQAFLGFPYLAELAQRSEYRNLSETIAKEMTRKWAKIVTTATDKKGAKKRKERIARLEELMREHNLQGVFRKAAEHDGFFGRGHIYIDTGDEDKADELSKPLLLNRAKVPAGTKVSFRTVEPVWVYPDQYNASDPLKPDYFRPSTWFVMNKRVHRSRLLTIVSREIPDLFKPAFAFSGLSLSQMARPYVENWLRTRQSVSDLVAAFSTMVLATDMESELEGDVGELTKRVKMFNEYRSNSGTMLINKGDEELTNVSAPLSTLDSLQAQSQEHQASVGQIPLVKLFGITPTGLNASSDGEIRVFYDGITSKQEHIFERDLITCLQVLQLAEWGDIDPSIGVVFPSLWQLDDAGKAAVQKSQADTAAVYIEAAVVSAEEERERLAADEEGLYRGVDLSGPPPEPPEADNEDEDAPPGTKASAGGNPAKSSVGASGV